MEHVAITSLKYQKAHRHVWWWTVSFSHGDGWSDSQGDTHTHTHVWTQTKDKQSTACSINMSGNVYWTAHQPWEKNPRRNMPWTFSCSQWLLNKIVRSHRIRNEKKKHQLYKLNSHFALCRCIMVISFSLLWNLSDCFTLHIYIVFLNFTVKSTTDHLSFLIS